MKKLPDKVGPSISQDTTFLKEINLVVWDVETTPEDFESKWTSIISSYELCDNKWLKKMFKHHALWIHAYIRDTYLGGILRTTLRSESENSFFGNFTNPHVTLVEFWMRFQTAMDAQRWKYSKVMADDKNCYPKLTTPLLLEKQASEVYTIVIFYIFQVEVQAACYTCGHLPSPNATGENDNISIIDREKDKEHKVDLSDNKFSCSCKMFERIGILCRHILWVLKDRGFDHIPKEYLALRWSKSATSHPLSNVVGKSVLADFKSGKSKDKKAEIEMLLGSNIPTEVTVLPPEKFKNKGSGKRITSNKEKAVLENAKLLRKCRACGEMSNHDSRNCPSRLP
ncbi:protein FAR-RED IMPAIRED RESPONSE 1-like [Silene latifolia]|uniref:protein FAR-RED IMPAIRED RESPONSE 1-like n=1 Tax=Silene latifolia TaxID=37657 RepID=UPI003D76D229